MSEDDALTSDRTTHRRWQRPRAFAEGFAAGLHLNANWIVVYFCISAGSILLCAWRLGRCDDGMRLVSMIGWLSLSLFLVAGAVGGLWPSFQRTEPVRRRAMTAAAGFALFLVGVSIQVAVLLDGCGAWYEGWPTRLTALGFAIWFLSIVQVFGVGWLLGRCLNTDFVQQYADGLRSVLRGLAGLVLFVAAMERLVYVPPQIGVGDLRPTLASKYFELGHIPGLLGEHIAPGGARVQDVLVVAIACVFILAFLLLVAFQHALGRSPQTLPDLLWKACQAPGPLHRSRPRPLGDAPEHVVLKAVEDLNTLQVFPAITLLFAMLLPIAGSIGTRTCDIFTVVVLGLFVVGGAESWVLAMELCALKRGSFVSGVLMSSAGLYGPSIIIAAGFLATLLIPSQGAGAAVLLEHNQLRLTYQILIGVVTLMHAYRSVHPRLCKWPMRALRYVSAMAVLATSAGFIGRLLLGEATTMGVVDTLVPFVFVGVFLVTVAVPRWRQDRLRCDESVLTLATSSSLIVAPLLLSPKVHSFDVTDHGFFELKLRGLWPTRRKVLRVFVFGSELALAREARPRRTVMGKSKPPFDFILTDLGTGLRITVEQARQSVLFPPYRLAAGVGTVEWLVIRNKGHCCADREVGAGRLMLFPAPADYPPNSLDREYDDLLRAANEEDTLYCNVSKAARYARSPAEQCLDVVLPEPYVSWIGTAGGDGHAATRRSQISTRKRRQYVLLSAEAKGDFRTKAMMDLLRLGAEVATDSRSIVNTDKIGAVCRFYNLLHSDDPLAMNGSAINLALFRCEFGLGLDERLNYASAACRARRRLRLFGDDESERVGPREFGEQVSEEPAFWRGDFFGARQAAGGAQQDSHTFPLAAIPVAGKPDELDRLVEVLSGHFDLTLLATANLGTYRIVYVVPRRLIDALSLAKGANFGAPVDFAGVGMVATWERVLSTELPSEYPAALCSAAMVPVRHRRGGLTSLLAALDACCDDEASSHIRHTFVFPKNRDVAAAIFVPRVGSVRQLVSALQGEQVQRPSLEGSAPARRVRLRPSLRRHWQAIFFRASIPPQCGVRFYCKLPTWTLRRGGIELWDYEIRKSLILRVPLSLAWQCWLFERLGRLGGPGLLGRRVGGAGGFSAYKQRDNWGVEWEEDPRLPAI